MMAITGLIKKECDYCGLSFSGRRRISNKVFFCSNSCKSKYYSIHKRKGKYYPCDWCNKRTYKTPCRVVRNDHIFCSKSCNDLWRKGKTIAPEETLFKKNHTPFNKGKNHKELFGEEKAKEMSDINKSQRLAEWEDLDYRKKQMKHRTPERLKKFREKGKQYARSEENITRLKSIKHTRKVIDKIL